ncbi:GH1 family beta-glucosidase [Nocardioides ultimimeridianus]
MSAPLTFPADFVWGVATASYQIEGAVAEDGRGPSIWDTFAHTPGRIAGGDHGDVACDHYHRWAEDLDLMASLGARSYRFSMSWSRVLPDARTVNRAGVDFYSRLVDGMLERGITPMATLYHWDLPQVLDDGPHQGWLSRDVADRFAEYAELMGRVLGDRVPTFTTLNEPWCSAYLGYAKGEHAPGLQDNGLSLRAAHHLNLAHGRAVTALRAVLPEASEVSVTLNLQEIWAASDSEADKAAAEHADLVANRIWLDPMLRGHYPAELVEQTRHLTDWSYVEDGDLEVIHQPLDFLGVNFYNPAAVAASDGLPFPGTDRAFYREIEGPRTVMEWPIQPSGLTDLLLRVDREYGIPQAITENGIACADVVGPDGVVHDADRIDYVDAHLAAVHAAIAQGADVRGYFLWTFLDNFEWAWGYDKRFGIIHVDHDTLDRTPKDSARWYAETIARNGLDRSI